MDLTFTITGPSHHVPKTQPHPPYEDQGAQKTSGALLRVAWDAQHSCEPQIETTL